MFDQETGKLLEDLVAADLSDIEKANVLNTKDEYEKNKKVPTEFVEKTSAAISKAFQSWDKAKKAKDFSLFAPDLEVLLELYHELYSLANQYLQWFLLK